MDSLSLADLDELSDGGSGDEQPRAAVKSKQQAAASSALHSTKRVKMAAGVAADAGDGNDDDDGGSGGNDAAGGDGGSEAVRRRGAIAAADHMMGVAHADGAAGDAGDSDDDSGSGSGSSDEDEDEDEEDDDASEPQVTDPLSRRADPAEVSELHRSDKFRQLLERVKAASQAVPARGAGALEDLPDYKLVVDCNHFLVEIESEIAVLHRFARDVYSEKFPELESCVPNGMDYARVVLAMRNDAEVPESALAAFLSPQQVMIVSVSASTTHGKPLSAEALARVVKGCEITVWLDESRTLMFKFVESRMQMLAPNLCALIGAQVAARLCGAAGGLTALSRTPAANVQVIGARRRNMVGMSTRVSNPHTGYIFEAELVKSTPPRLRNNACRLVAAKIVLAARVDAFRGTPDGTKGRELYDEVAGKIEKLQEPPTGKEIKALPAPIDKPKKRRGGKNARRLKERFGVTEVRKQMNRVEFGGQEESYRDTGFGFGMLGKSGSGKVRVAVKDSKTMAKTKKMLQRDATESGMRTSRVSGLASSLAFTPVQGLELDVPSQSREVVAGALRDAKDGYFSSLSGFQYVRQRPSAGQ